MPKRTHETCLECERKREELVSLRIIANRYMGLHKSCLGMLRQARDQNRRTDLWILKLKEHCEKDPDLYWEVIDILKKVFGRDWPDGLQ